MGYLMEQTGPDPETIDEISYEYYIEEEDYERVFLVYLGVDKVYADVYGNKLIDMSEEIGAKNAEMIDSETAGMEHGGEFTYFIMNKQRHAVYEVLATNIGYSEHLEMLDM